jgi:hypothetical protein
LSKNSSGDPVRVLNIIRKDGANEPIPPAVIELQAGNAPPLLGRIIDTDIINFINGGNALITTLLF